jgi:hypothetical protein
MSTESKKSGGWGAVRQHLNTYDKPALLALIKELYGLTPVSRDFLLAHSQAGDSTGDAIEKYRGKIINQFFPKRGDGKLKLGEARKAIRDYQKATGNVLGTAELLMTYVENGTKFTSEYGDIDERFYNSIESAMDELSDLLKGEAREFYPQFHERLDDVLYMSDGIGWGFHDYIRDVILDLEEELEEDE